MKRLIIGIIVIIVLMSFGLIGFIPGILADPPEGTGAPANIVSPLDENGNVKVSVDSTVEVTASTPVPVHEQGVIQVTPTGPISVTAAAPLQVVLPPPPSAQITSLFDDVQIYKETAPPSNPPVILSLWQDVKMYSKFKIYIKLTPGPVVLPGDPIPTPPIIFYSILDSVGGGELGFNYVGGASSWNYFPSFPSGGYWATSYYFEGLFSEIALSMFYPAGPDGADSYDVNAWLLMGN